MIAQATPLPSAETLVPQDVWDEMKKVQVRFENAKYRVKKYLLGRDVRLTYGKYKGRTATICGAYVQMSCAGKEISLEINLVVDIHRLDGNGFLDPLDTHSHRVYRLKDVQVVDRGMSILTKEKT